MYNQTPYTQHFSPAKKKKLEMSVFIYNSLQIAQAQFFKKMIFEYIWDERKAEMFS